MVLPKAERELSNSTESWRDTSRTGVSDRHRSKLCALFDAGRVAYKDGLDLQRKSRDLVAKGGYDGLLMLLEHDPIITFGRNGGRENLTVAEPELKARGLELIQTERGGNITCHNPGQLVVYPILNLKKWKQDVHWYVRTIEETVIRTLAHYQVQAARKSAHTGVWVNDKKIAAIGVFVSRWITSHGLALNVNNDLSLFSSMNPCGISCYGVTSLEQLGVSTEIPTFKKVFISEFGSQFECKLEEEGELFGLTEETGPIVSG